MASVALTFSGLFDRYWLDSSTLSYLHQRRAVLQPHISSSLSGPRAESLGVYCRVAHRVVSKPPTSRRCGGYSSYSGVLACMDAALHSGSERQVRSPAAGARAQSLILPAAAGGVVDVISRHATRRGSPADKTDWNQSCLPGRPVSSPSGQVQPTPIQRTAVRSAMYTCYCVLVVTLINPGRGRGGA